MSKQEHPYAQVLRWIADGETVEACNPDYENWFTVTTDTALYVIRHGTNAGRPLSPGHFRLKPRTISINGHEVPEPMREAPDKPGGVQYYVPWFSAIGAVADFTWNDNHADRWMLSRGLCHATREAAEAHAKALLSFTETKA